VNRYVGVMIGLFVLTIILCQVFPTQTWIPFVGLGITAVSSFVYVVLSVIIYVRKRNEAKKRVCCEQQHC
jgi:intracellular septation protein A